MSVFQHFDDLSDNPPFDTNAISDDWLSVGIPLEGENSPRGNNLDSYDSDTNDGLHGEDVDNSRDAICGSKQVLESDININEEENVDNHGRDHNHLNQQQKGDHEDDENIAEVGGATISAAISALSPSYILPSSIIRMTSLQAGTFIAGYVVESCGNVGISNSKENGPARGPSDRPPSKKIKLNDRTWHAVYLADDQSIIKIWARAYPNSSAERLAAVKSLSSLQSGTYAALYIRSVPVEVSTSNPAYKKYETCPKDCEILSLKRKTLQPIHLPAKIPEFSLASSDAYNVRTWSEIDEIVHNAGNSFEVNITRALVALNERHKPRKARNGARYLSGYVEDQHRVTRFLSVWSHLEAFLDRIPNDISSKHVVLEFHRLCIPHMNHSGHGSAMRVACISQNTSFKVVDMAYYAFTSQVASAAVNFHYLEGFE